MNKAVLFRKKGFWVILICAFLMTVMGCSKENTPQSKDDVAISSTTTTILDDNQDEKAKMREIAWNSLSARQQGDVQGKWQEAKVERIKGSSIWYGIAMDDQNSEMPNDVVLVTFNTLQDQLLGPLVIYIDAETEKRIGVGVRE